MTTPISNPIPRPPVVAIMGHIDHGKSTLLDYIRKSNIVEGEAGGITQRLSGYEAVHTGDDGEEKKITFLDTPGHEAFKAMRSRGANAADIVILVVAADDGVKEQTMEAYTAITEAHVPYVVAINKIDKPNANIERVKQDLAERGIFLEGYGGRVTFAPISAKSGEGVDALLDLVLLTAELEGLVGDLSKSAEGVVIESHVDPKKGTSATLLIKDGTLKNGMYVVAGSAMAPTRMIENFVGARVTSATFSSPVHIIGFDKAPAVGSLFVAVSAKKDAERIRTTGIENRTASTETLTPHSSSQNRVFVPILIKADALGAVDALLHEIEKLANEFIAPKIVANGVGDITDNDIRLLGSDVHGVVVGFNVKITAQARDLAERAGIAVGTFDIIYRMTEWLQEEFIRRTPKREIEERQGMAKVLKTFSRNKEKQIIGGEVIEGMLSHGARFKILRRDEEIGRGKVIELQQQKVKADKVAEGNQFGAQMESRIEIAPGDRLEAFETIVK